ncbi:MAG: arsenate reductase ArsC [Candidatus Thalassarchaeaceae archaeon]|jgi:arsenate reductase|nr:arsenate reductase ArsC [Candidatus Thalassarchaeaceae archaeon]
MRILFVCVGNSCRSQIAEGWGRHFGLEVASAGTNPAKKVAPKSVIVMEEVGIDISQQSPSVIDNYKENEFDFIISMGCGVSCPSIRIDVDWELEDPIGQSLDVYRTTRDIIEQNVRTLLETETRTDA